MIYCLLVTGSRIAVALTVTKLGDRCDSGKGASGEDALIPDGGCGPDGAASW